MKAKLLKKLRTVGRNQINIYSVTKTTTWRGEFITGMSYSYSNNDYSGLFELGDTEEDVRNKAMEIYFKNNIDFIREKYKNYARKYKKS